MRHTLPKFTYMQFLVTVTISSAVITLILYTFMASVDECKCPMNNVKPIISEARHNNTTNGKYKLAVLVPFRERFNELLIFAPYLHKFLNAQNIPHDIFILNQVDYLRFNRASLINIGFIFTKTDYDYIAMHDVDLLPLNKDLRYDYPRNGPHHVAAPNLHPRYHYPKFVGGILLIKREHFEVVKGMSNRYWGWGLEDDEFFVRMKDANLTLTRPTNISTGTADTFRHIHDKNHRKRDTSKCFNQKEVTRKRDRQTGLHDVKYTITQVNKLSVNEAPVTVVNIELICDRNLTPWCDCEGAPKM